MLLTRISKQKKYLLTALLPLLSLTANASSEASIQDSETFIQVLLGITTVISFLVLIAVVIVYKVVHLLLIKEEEKVALAEGREAPVRLSFWDRFNQSMTDAVPIENEAEILLDHDYDGIKELDNHLPPWWKYLFYATIVFAAVYLALYQVFDVMPNQEQEYQAELKIAEQQKLLAAMSIDENSVEFSDDPEVLASGAAIYAANCAACHRDDGGGGVGPNLTDDYWIHGGTIGDIFKTIKYGVPQKGMISWQKKLTPSKISDVSSYIKSIRGTNPENAKEPQGVEVKE
ncbi:hypothetical protein AUTU_37980 [Aureibacter tunicatorum]|nr:hypothetical protein AUTU_37980 [Aureibacter tunicatorum]